MMQFLGPPTLFFRLLSEESCNFFDGLVFGLRHLEEDISDKEGLDHDEYDEDIRADGQLWRRKLVRCAWTSLLCVTDALYSPGEVQIPIQPESSQTSLRALRWRMRWACQTDWRAHWQRTKGWSQGQWRTQSRRWWPSRWTGTWRKEPPACDIKQTSLWVCWQLRVRVCTFTLKMRQKSSSVVDTNMMARPTIIRVFLPDFSISAKETKVIATFTAPMPRVALWAPVLSRPADLKIEVE